MEGFKKGKGGAEAAGAAGAGPERAPAARESLVERKRQEAFASVCDAFEARIPAELGERFEVNGREYQLTSAEDCMVAFAGALRAEIVALHQEVIAKDDYYEEKATAKLLELFRAYERLVALYAELRSYYPAAAARIEPHLSPLSESLKHGQALFKKVQASNQ